MDEANQGVLRVALSPDSAKVHCVTLRESLSIAGP